MRFMIRFMKWLVTKQDMERRLRDFSKDISDNRPFSPTKARFTQCKPGFFLTNSRFAPEGVVDNKEFNMIYC